MKQSSGQPPGALLFWQPDNSLLRPPRRRRAAARGVQIQLRDLLCDVPRCAAAAVRQDDHRQPLLRIADDAIGEPSALAMVAPPHRAMVAIDEPAESVL